MPSFTSPTLHVDSLDQVMKTVEQAGGKIVVPKTTIPNVGQYAFFTDPEGVIVGVFQQ